MRLVYSVRPARYAKDRYLVRCPSPDGYKTRAARLAAAYARNRYTNRESGYLLSARQVERFRACYRAGCDASVITLVVEHSDTPYEAR